MTTEKHMKEIRDTEKLETVYQSQAHLFGKRPPFLRLLAYEKGELLNPPFQNLDQFLIVVEGNIVIYSLLEDGSIRHLFNSEHGILLGDIEYSGNTGKTLFIEAQEHVLTLSIPFVSDALPLTFRLPLPPAPRLLLFRLPDSGTPSAQFTSGTLLSALKPLVSATVVLFPALSVARTQIL